MYIDRVRKKPNGEEEREELCYWRKFWLLHGELGLYGADDYGNDVPMTKQDVRRALHFIIEQEDYFGGFNTVPELAIVLRDYDEYKEDGWDIVYNANW